MNLKEQGAATLKYLNFFLPTKILLKDPKFRRPDLEAET